MALLLSAWVGLIVFYILYVVKKAAHGGGGLSLAYLVTLSLIHVPGAFVLSLSSTTSTTVAEASYIGFEATIIAISCFVVGALVAQFRARARKQDAGTVQMAGRRRFTLRTAAYFLGVGVLFNFILLPLSLEVSSTTAIVMGGSGFLVLGVVIIIKLYTNRSRAIEVVTVAACMVFLPIATLAARGIIQYGVTWATSIVAFYFVEKKSKALIMVAAPIALMLGLSAFATYMSGRDFVREAVWQQNSGYGDRLSRIESVFSQFKFLDFDDYESQSAILRRLNQNYFVGLTILRLESNSVSYANGSTVALWALVPRALWPDKPEVGGGGAVVANFTGLDLSKSTSWGAGQVLEFYANFGMLGLVIGFLAWGFLLMRLDLALSEGLQTGDLDRFILAGLVGLSMVQPEGNLLEILVRIVSALTIAMGVRVFRRPLRLRRAARSIPSTGLPARNP